MQTQTTTIFESLQEIMSQVETSNQHNLQTDIQAFSEYCHLGIDDDSEKLLSTIYLNALRTKLHSTGLHENHYEKKFEVSQIELFDILIHKFPYVKYGQEIVNQSILECMNHKEVVTLVDIGCGLGTQMVHIIQHAAQLTSLQKLVIIGIEPFPEALKQAEEQIKIAGCDKHFSVEFKPIIEKAEYVDYNSMMNLEGFIIVNASLALHHIQTWEQRRITLQGIKQLQADAFFLTEPNSDHTTSNFMKRFQNSYNHFLSLFKVIDLLDIETRYKQALKLFFGREIEDIIGKPEVDRFEKHALASDWLTLLREVGFTFNTSFFKDQFLADPGVSIALHPEGYIGFTFEQETALAIMLCN